MTPVLMQTAVALLTYAYGANWNAARAQRDMLMFEYFGTWAHGDQYVYVETQNLATRRANGTSVDSGLTTPYVELHARLGGPTLFSANQVDLSQGDVALLTGAGIAWGVIQTDVFVRYDPALPKPTWQAIVYGDWGLRIAHLPLRYGGYVKVVGPEGPYPAFLVSDTRLLWEPRSHLGIGAALRVWRNENGIKGLDQTIPEAVIQWRF